MLQVRDLNVFYGGIHATKGVNLEVNQGEIVSLIGANGAGKTTILQTISGLIRPKSGSISFLSQDLLSVEAHKIVGMGLAQVPEGRRVFAGLTVKENLQMGAFSLKASSHDVLREARKEVYDRFPRLRERKNQLAGTLSGGEQQMLAMGRALMSRPKMLLLDEPSMGLAPILVKDIFSIIKEVSESGVTILLVEQNAKVALSISNRAYVIETGTIAMSGDAADLMASDEVKKAYLGA